MAIKVPATESVWHKALIIAIVGVLSGGTGYMGSSLDARDHRPDPFTGKDGRALALDIRDIKNKIARMEKKCEELRSLVRAHNDNAWEWKQRIMNCEKDRLQ